MNTESIREKLQEVVKGVGGPCQAKKILQEAGLNVSSGAITYWITKSKMSSGACRQRVLPVIKCLTAEFLKLSEMLEKVEKPLPDITQSDVLAKLRELVAKHGTVVAAANYVMSQTDYPRRGWGLDTTIRSWLKKERLSEKDKIKILRINQILGRPFRIKSLLLLGRKGVRNLF